MDGQPTARSSTSALLWGCEGLGQIRTAKSQVDLKSHQPLMRSFGELWGTQVPSCPFYTRPSDPVRTLPVEAMDLIMDTQLFISHILPVALGPVENGHRHPVSWRGPEARPA